MTQTQAPAFSQTTQPSTQMTAPLISSQQQAAALSVQPAIAATLLHPAAAATAAPSMASPLAGLPQTATSTVGNSDDVAMAAAYAAVVAAAGSADGLGISAPHTLAGSSSTGRIAAQLQQHAADNLLAQQAAIAVAINNPGTAQSAAPIQPQQQPQQQQQTMASAEAAVAAATAAAVASQTSQPRHSHTRSISVVDGMVAMYPNEQPSNTATATSMVMQLQQAQLQAQLQEQQTIDKQNAQLKLSQSMTQLHQLQQLQATSSVSAAISALQSGVPSPFATPLPGSGNAMPPGHRRQLSSTFPAPMQHPMLPLDTPVTLATAPATIVPGTPTSFGQLP
ncbi:hypothetical protein EC988_007970, partial [Linderina pennispora]